MLLGGSLCFTIRILSFRCFCSFIAAYMCVFVYCDCCLLTIFIFIISGCCPSRSAVSKLRSEAVYTEFMRQWNVGVYFSLRYVAAAALVIYLKRKPIFCLNRIERYLKKIRSQLID